MTETKNQQRAEETAPNTPEKSVNVKKGVALIMLSAFCFSLMSLFVRLSGDLPTFQKAFFRNFVAFIAAFILLLKSGSLKMQKGNLPCLLGRSFAGVLGILGNFYAIDKMNISDASILNKLAPFFSVLFSIIILREKASWKDWAFVGLAFTGALFIAKPSFGFEQSIPALVGVVGALGAGLAYTFVRKLGMKGERPAYVVFFFSAFSSLVTLPLFLYSYQPMKFTQLAFLLLAGAAASGAQFSLTFAYKYAPAKEVSVYDYSQVIFTALLGMVFLSEFPDYLSVIGYVIIIGSAFLKYCFRNKKGSPKTEEK